MNEQNSASHNSHRAVEIGSPLDERSAYHQAGRAAAIYIGNKEKRLPAVHFQIVTKRRGADNIDGTNQLNAVNLKRTAIVEGGRLIHSLTLPKMEAMQDLSAGELQEYQLAYEADIVNILSGPLAEAKYVALRDHEIFNPNRLYAGALAFYDSQADMEMVNEYLASAFKSHVERDRKLAELFLAAYVFVNNRTNWQAISALANHILEYPKDILDCNEIIALLKSSRLAA